MRAYTLRAALAARELDELPPGEGESGMLRAAPWPLGAPGRRASGSPEAAYRGGSGARCALTSHVQIFRRARCRERSVRTMCHDAARL